MSASLGSRVRFSNAVCGDNDPWRAVSALGRTFFYEYMLNFTAPFVFDQPLDGEDLATCELGHRSHAVQD